jgi:Ala-tRNA(Pro) deacylase
MSIAQSVELFLKERDIDYDLVRHPRTVTSLRTAEMAHVPGTQVAKSVLLEDETGYLIAVIPATHRLDLGKLRQQLRRPIVLAVEREVAKIFPDCERGAIPAIGPAYRVETVIDDNLLAQPDVYFEAGDHEALVHMSGPAFGAMMAGVRHGQFAHHA